jgi:hypothetical protein
MSTSQLESMSEFEFHEMMMAMAKQYVFDHGGNTTLGRDLFHPFRKPMAFSGFEMWEQRYPVCRAYLSANSGGYDYELVGLWEYDKPADAKPTDFPSATSERDEWIRGFLDTNTHSINLIYHDPICLHFRFDGFAYALSDYLELNLKQFADHFLGRVPGFTIRMLHPSEWTTLEQYKKYYYGLNDIDRGPQSFTLETGPIFHRQRQSPRPTEPYEPLSNHALWRLSRCIYRDWHHFVP